MRRQLVLTAIAFALYGLSKVVFNFVANRTAGPVTVADVNALIALHTVLVIFLIQPIAGTIQRFAPEYLASEQRERARRLLSGGLLLVLSVSALILLGLLFGRAHAGRLVSLVEPRLYVAALPYGVGYALYFLFKMGYYGFRRVGQYCVAETVACAVFFALLAHAALEGGGSRWLWPWLAHPFVFALVALWHFRRDLRWPLRNVAGHRRTGTYVAYAFYWLAATASGFGAYHLSIVFANRFVQDAGSVGYFCVALSLLTPLNFLPVTISMVLYPQMTTNFATGSGLRNAELIRSFTTALAVLLGLITVSLLGLAPEILELAGVPPTARHILVFQLMAAGVVVSLVSMPAGSFLSATKYARTSALIGLSTLALGVAGWLLFTPWAGIVGVAAGYGLFMAARGAANMNRSHRYSHWAVGASPRLALVPLFLAAAAALGLLAQNALARWTGVAVTLIAFTVVFSPTLLAMAREISAREETATSEQAGSPPL